MFWNNYIKYLKTKLIGGQDALMDLLDDFK